MTANSPRRPVRIAFVGIEEPPMETAWGKMTVVAGAPSMTEWGRKRTMLACKDSRKAAMAGKAEFTFDPKAFLATVGPGHTVSDLRKERSGLPSGELQQTRYFTSRRARSRLWSRPSRARKRWSGS